MVCNQTERRFQQSTCSSRELLLNVGTWRWSNSPISQVFPGLLRAVAESNLHVSLPFSTVEQHDLSSCAEPYRTTLEFKVSRMRAPFGYLQIFAIMLLDGFSALLTDYLTDLLLTT